VDPSLESALQTVTVEENSCCRMIFRQPPGGHNP
jgi:hypothetical protein